MRPGLFMKQNAAGGTYFQDDGYAKISRLRDGKIKISYDSEIDAVHIAWRLALLFGDPEAGWKT